MKRLVLGRFSGASIATPAGELEVRFSDGGTWQIRGRPRHPEFDPTR
jgi:hypothetical protein